MSIRFGINIKFDYLKGIMKRGSTTIRIYKWLFGINLVLSFKRKCKSRNLEIYVQVNISNKIIVPTLINLKVNNVMIL